MSAFWIPIPYKLGPDHVEIYRPLKEAQREAQSKKTKTFLIYILTMIKKSASIKCIAWRGIIRNIITITGFGHLTKT